MAEPTRMGGRAATSSAAAREEAPLYELIELLFSPTAISSATPIGCWRPSVSAAPIIACCISSAATPA